MTGQQHRSRVAQVLRAIWTLMRDAADGWMTHRASSTGAALACYTIFSLAPGLIISIPMAGLFFGEAAARGEDVGQVRDHGGAQGPQPVQSVPHAHYRPAARLRCPVLR